MQPDAEIRDSFAVSSWQQTPATTAWCRANYHRLLLVTAGHGGLQVDDVPYEVQGSELFLVAKGQLFAWGEGTELQGFSLAFGDCFWEKAPASASNCKAVLFNNASANQHLRLQPQDLQELHTLFQTLHTEYGKPDYLNKPDALAAYLKIIMIKTANVHALLTQGSDNHESRLYRAFLELVSQQYHTSHEVAGFARQLGISPRKLSDLCRRCAGQGAKEIINGQLIAEAKRFLQFSVLPVKEIAFELNFSNPDQFSHFFKKSTQFSPHQYREHFVNFGR